MPDSYAKNILHRQSHPEKARMVCWSLTSLCHSNGHIETMPAREINPFTALTRIRSQFLRTHMIDEHSSASGHDYASDRSAILGSYNANKT